MALFVTKATTDFKNFHPKESADTISLCLFTLFHRMGLSNEELRQFLQHLYEVHDEIQQEKLTMDDIKTSLSEGGANIPIDAIYPKESPMETLQESMKDPFFSSTISDLERQKEVLVRIRRETNPNNYIGLWGYNESAHQYNTVSAIAKNISKVIKIKKLKNEH